MLLVLLLVYKHLCSISMETEFPSQIYLMAHLDKHCRLTVAVCGENLLLLGRDEGVAGDECSHNAVSCFDTQRQRGDIQRHHILNLCVTVPRQHYILTTLEAILGDYVTTTSVIG